MQVNRHFTKSGQSPYEGIPFEPRTSTIRNPDGSTVFNMENVMVPAHWSQVATDIHLPAEFRSDAVRNVHAWYDAYRVAAGDTLYLEPGDRISIW